MQTDSVPLQNGIYDLPHCPLNEPEYIDNQINNLVSTIITIHSKTEKVVQKIQTDDD